MNRQQFFDVLAPQALRARREGSPMFVSVRLAQNLLETGGKIHSWNNLGGIKVGSGVHTAYWYGKAVRKGTWEVYNGRTVETAADFRAYDSVYHFYRDQDLLFQLPRYARVRESKTPEEQCAMLQACGYATDPAYPGKLMAIIKQNDLKKYDEEDDDVELSNYQWGRIVTGVESLLARKVISDEAWLSKAKSKTLTRDELAWLTFEVAVNR